MPATPSKKEGRLSLSQFQVKCERLLEWELLFLGGKRILLSEKISDNYPSAHQLFSDPKNRVRTLQTGSGQWEVKGQELKVDTHIHIVNGS